MRHDSAPWSSNVPHIEQRWVNMQSRPYGHPAGALLKRRHRPRLLLSSKVFQVPPILQGWDPEVSFPSSEVSPPCRTGNGSTFISGESGGSTQPVPSHPTAAKITPSGDRRGHLGEMFHPLYCSDGQEKGGNGSEYGVPPAYRAKTLSESSRKCGVARI